MRGDILANGGRLLGHGDCDVLIPDRWSRPNDPWWHRKLRAPGASIHHTWARRKLRALFPAVGNLRFEHAWNGTIAVTGDHVPKMVAFGPNAYACFGYSGRGIGPGTVFGTQAAIALLERKPEELPIAPTEYYSEHFTRVKAVYYALGATVVHAVSPPLRSAAKR